MPLRLSVREHCFMLCSKEKETESEADDRAGSHAALDGDTGVGALLGRRGVAGGGRLVGRVVV